MSDSDSRKTTVNFRMTEATHDRVTDHKRDGETIDGTIGRALDALEREAALPDAVELAMKGRVTEDGAADLRVTEQETPRFELVIADAEFDTDEDGLRTLTGGELEGVELHDPDADSDTGTGDGG